MTVEEIADFCEFKDCRVSAGAPQTGFIHIDGTGLENQDVAGFDFRDAGEAWQPLAATRQPDDFNVALVGKIVQVPNPFADNIRALGHAGFDNVVGQVEQIFAGISCLAVTR